MGLGGAKIVSAAININADLTFASYSATNLRSATFAAGQAVSGARTLYVGADTELYWNNSASGTAIKLTDGTSLNVAGFIGGIGGDYTSVSAELNYDDGGARYTFRKGGGTTWARVAAGEVRLHEHASTTSVYVALSSPAALAGTYTVTFPAAVPAGKRLVQCSAAGVLTFENTGIEASTFSGLITASAGVTCAADQHVTVSGTGEVKHGDRVLALPGCVGKSATNANVTYGATVGNIEATAAIDMVFPIPLLVGDRIKSITFARYGDGAADITNAEVLKVSSAGSGTSLGTTSVTNPAAGYNDTTIDLTDTTMASGESFFFVVTVSAANIRIHNIRVTYDRP